MARAKEDEVLARKVVRMKELLHHFCPRFNDEFWQEASKRSAYLQRHDYASTADMLADLEARSQVTTGKTVRIAAKDAGAEGFTLARVWDEQEREKRVWRLVLCNSREDTGTAPETYQTFNKLCVRLQKLGARELPRKDDLRQWKVYVELGE
jgi:hypothetical protein